MLPLVVYRGARRWNAPRDVSELVESPPGSLAGYVPNLSYFLVEERRLDEEELAQMSNLVARIFHIEKSDELETSVRVLAGALSSLRASGAVGERLRRDLVSWFRRVQEPAKMIPKDALLERSYEELEPMLAESVKRWKEELLAEGEKSGLARGLAEGEKSGLARGRIEILVEMLQARFGDVPPDLRERLADADEQRLRELAVRLSSADSVEELIGEYLSDG